MEDRVDRYCTYVHVACIGLQRLKRQSPYSQDNEFLTKVEEFCQAGKILMKQIREYEAQLRGKNGIFAEKILPAG